MAEQISEDIAGLLDIFVSADSLDDRLTALTELIKRRALHAVREDARLDSGMSSLGGLAADSPSDEQRLRAVAALSRIGTVKSLVSKVEGILYSVLEKPLPDIASLKDPDDRYYVAKALHVGKADWIPTYTATGIVEEKQAETARQELVSVLFKRFDDLAQVFRLLADSLKSFTPETKNSGDSVAKRLERILAAVRPQAVAALMEPGEHTGQCLQDMLQAAFSGARFPETQDVAEKALEEIAGLIHDIARTQLSLVTEPSLYAVLDIPKRWFSTPIWRYIAEKSTHLNLVRRDIRDALTLLAKQDVTDVALFNQLVTASGSRESAIKITASIAKRHPELSGDTRAWLRGGGKLNRRPILGVFEESRELSADPFLATLMANIAQLQEALSGISEDTQTELRLMEPSLAEPLDVLFNQCRTVIHDVEALATKRGLQVKGGKGDVVDYSPAIHELIGGHLQGIRKVRIVQPMIQREGLEGGEMVVRKALVDKL